MNNRDKWVPQTAWRYSNLLNRMKEGRKSEIKELRKTRPKRKSLSEKQRAEVLKKTARRCHICGGRIKRGQEWQADHVYAYSKGGKHSADNYLPAHTTCNNYRWHYGTEEIQEILKLGVWLRTQISRKTDLGMDAAERFVKHERTRIRRRKNRE